MPSRQDTIFYNASGYADPTAAEAIRKVLNMTRIVNPGEIWSFEDGKTVLVLAVNGELMNYTVLSYTDNGHADIHIRGQHGNSTMLAYTWVSNADTYIETLTKTEFDGVLSLIAGNFGIGNKVVEIETKVPESPSDAEYLRAKVEVLEAMNDKLLAKLLG